MTQKSLKFLSLVMIIALLFSGSSFGRAAIDLSDTWDTDLSAASPSHAILGHRVGKIVLAVNNNGTFGDGFARSANDFFTGEFVPPCEYPKNSNGYYLFAGAFWIGAVVGRDTLVSEGADGWSRNGNEFNPDVSPFGDPIYRSIRFPDVPELYEGAVSEEDYILKYADTLTQGVDADFSGRPHVPLNIEVTQKSYAWSYPYAEDFVLFDYEIRNIGDAKLTGTYMGFYCDADIGWASALDYHIDDICGFRETFVSSYKGACEYEDTVNIAYIADNDGDPQGGVFTDESVPNVTAMRIVRTPSDQLDVSFNWWISNGSAAYDFGPRERAGVGAWEEDFRDFRTSGGIGTPEGDRNKYYILRNQEFDYDQIYTAVIQPTDTLWSTPPQDQAGTLADGYDTRYLLSFGPFDISPGEKLPISFAYVGGMNFHRNPDNLVNLPSNPDEYYANIDLSDLALNASWAEKVYDNPGVDTDGDSVYGVTRTCCFDSTLTDSGWVCTTSETYYYKGDGVPDFQGASPPPPPTFWLEPSEGSIKVRFNGYRSETTADVFSRLIDFEGYRIYVGRDTREASFSLVGSYDIEDYNKFVYNPNKLPEPGYELQSIPFSIEDLRCLYGDSTVTGNPCGDTTFDPLAYTRNSPYVMPDYPDSVFYFEGQDYNVSDLGGLGAPISKTYPDQPYPSTLDPDFADSTELTEDGYFKYFEYEVLLEDLLPTVDWWVSITAFDFGSPESGLPSLESPKANGAQGTYPLPSAQEVAANGLKVFVYPNPYRIDGDYRANGYEGRLDSDRPDDRVRAVHFANLPAKCTIKIYSLDGDMIREIEHNYDIDDPMAANDVWDLVTRNTQRIVSGLYYWVVEAENGETQVGKLAIIM